MSLFGTSTFTKKVSFYTTLLFLGIGVTSNSYGQLVGSSAVKANFGIDGDVYSDLLQFPNIANPAVPLPSQVATDDWFQTSYPGPGFGVIKQTDPIPVTANEAFSFRQSNTTPTAPFPFPVVVSGMNPQPYLWLDAVYGRDNYVKGGSAEKSYFAGSGDKNSDNPSTWSIGTAGSVPQKDDLLDVFAHLRGEGPRIPFSDPEHLDPRPFTTLYAYAAASLAVTNGNKHVDFEFFRTALETPADLSIAGKTGPDGGRTAFTFEDADGLDNIAGNSDDGAVKVPGTIIISVDYTNGGNVPQVRIRVWMDESVFNSYNNSNPFRPFTTVPGTFEKGELSGNFGYGVITANEQNSTFIWGRVNINASTQGPPWGTFEGSGPDPVTDFQPLQFVEIGINLTAFGLDKRGTQDPCSNILGSLLVKTRSSGGGPTEGAFGSELKDFAGPYLFGNTGNPPVVTVTPKAACAGVAVNLTTGSSTTGGEIEYFTTLTNGVYSNKISDPTAYTPGATHIYARSESLTNPGCYGYGEFDITVNPNPVALVLTGSSICASNPSTGTVSSSTSQSGVSYQLRIGTTNVQSPKAGTGSALTWTGLAAGTNYNVVSTGASPTNCPGSSNSVNITEVANPVDLILTGSSICASNPSTGTVSSSTSQSGVSYQLRIGTTNVQSPKAGTGSALTWTGLAAGTNYNVVSTGASPTNCPGSSNSVSITEVANPTCSITGEQSICIGGSSTFTATAGMKSYSWTGPGGFTAITQSINVSVAGIYEVTITNSSDCTSKCSRELMLVTCGGPLCTYTQGAYGNSGGKYCDGTTDGISTVDLITQAITNAGGTITVGKAGVSSVYMNTVDTSCIITQMPGGGKATEIVPAGDYPICPSLPNSFLKNGKINNVLLSQTIALSLNVNITSPSKLGAQILQAGTLATAKPVGGCGTSVPKARVCGHLDENGIWIPTANEYTYRTFSAAVINAINGDKTVAGLLDLANRALANSDGVKNTEGGASLSDIAGAVAAVNEVFDECAIFVGWDIQPCPEAPTLDLASVTTAKVSSTEPAGFDAYPVPFKDQLTIKYNFDYVSDVKIEVFNSKGILVYSMVDTNSYLGKEVVITINTTLEQQQVYYVRLTTSQGSTVKSVMSSY